MNTYIHQTNKRVRIRSDYIRQNPEKVSRLITKLGKINAIQHVTHKRHAGSVAIQFDNNELDSKSLLDILDSNGWLQSDGRPSFIENAVVSGTKTFARGMVGLALTRLVGPSVSRVIMSL
ncbi:HMA2 domain-containing protein [Endozoicomonas sp. GU-1]|uniref:HMA2 domain-containing protein n=1 Tax=Endozoicomonas sp. GU-1 TaxID=3009078 RepID=UPI0022B2C2D1|nr:hypothetical protein [Endozoicomonas sp. GU-1]WBA81896.1 hypothetical protein O2T12_01610 [Endozoicomonas sp. GU-1]WBA84850.1 hypothetical protein O3276_16410 [Endozoicomonas sp. GU-1]